MSQALKFYRATKALCDAVKAYRGARATVSDVKAASNALRTLMHDRTGIDLDLWRLTLALLTVVRSWLERPFREDLEHALASLAGCVSADLDAWSALARIELAA